MVRDTSSERRKERENTQDIMTWRYLVKKRKDQRSKEREIREEKKNRKRRFAALIHETTRRRITNQGNKEVTTHEM